MALELFSLFAKIALDSGEFEKGLSSASGLTKTFGDSAKAALGAVAKAAAVGLTAASAGVVAFGKSSVDAGMQFDSSMAQVAATMGKTVDEIGNLRDFAMEMGAKTAFSASQAADALNYMALAGYDAQTSMDMLPNVLNLAAAGGMELAAASDMITDSQSALGLSLDQTKELVDKMAKASSKTNTSVSQLGSAILTVGGTAKAMKGGTTELAQVLGIIADNGVKGAEGGTALRNIILSLTAPTDKAAKSLKELGVKVLDSSGNMRSMQDIFADLNKSLGNLSEGQKTAVLSEIFNKVDLKSVNALLATDVERWNELSVAIDDASGAAEAMANTQLDNLAGDIKIFQSAVEGAQIVLSDQLTPALREFVQFGTSGVTAVTDAFKREEAVRGLSDAIRDAEGNLLSAGQVAGVLSETLYSMSESDRQIAVREIFNTDDMEYINELLNENGENWGYLMGYVAEIDGAAQATNGWAAAMGTLGPVVSDAVSMILEGLPKAVEIGGQLLGAVVTGVIDALPALGNGALQLVEAFGTSIIDAAPSMSEKGAELLTFIGDGFSTGVPALTEKAAELAPALAQGIAGGIPAAAGAFAEAVTSLGSTIADNAPSLIDSGVQLLGGLVTGITEGLPKLTEAAVNLMTSFGGYLRDNLPMLVETGLSMLEGLSGSIRENAGKLVDGGMELLKNLAQGFVDSIPALIEHVPTIITNIAGVINDNAPKVLATGVSIIVTLAKGLIQAIPTIVANIPKIIQAVVAVFTAFNWLNVGKNIVTAIKNGITALKTAIPETMKSIGESAKNFIKNIDWPGVGSGIVNFIKGGITSLTDTIPKALWDIAQQGIQKITSIDWLSVGKNIVAGIGNGIGQFAHLALDAIGGLANRLLGRAEKELDMASPSKKFVWVGKMIDEGFAKGIQDNADKAEAEAEKLAKNVYSAVAKEAERQIKYERLSLTEQLELWRQIQGRFNRDSEQWLDAYDKIWDLEEKIADEQAKAAEQAAKDSYNALTKWFDKAAKYTDASAMTQIQTWKQALGAFKKDSEQYAEIEEKLFDLRLSAYKEYADKVEEISGNINEIQNSYSEEVTKRTREIANSYKLFDAIPERQEVSGKQLLENLQGQIKSIRSFYDNLAKLQERGMSDAVVNEIRAMGVGASDELEALLSLSDKKLSRYAEAYAEKQSLANSIAVSELGNLKNETESKIQEQMDDLRTLYEQNAPALGESFAEHLAQGIRNGLSGVAEAAAEAAQAALAKTREILGVGTSANAAPIRFPARAAAYAPAATSGPDAGLRYSPISFTVNNNVGGATYAQLQYDYDSAEEIRRGPSILNA